MAAHKRGTIAFSANNRSPVPLDIFSCPHRLPCPMENEELLMIADEKDSYNYSGQEIPPAALKTLLKHPRLELYCQDIEGDVNSGRLSGMVFVSERNNNLELLHIALCFNGVPPKFEVFSLADIFGESNFNGVRLEDSGCFSADYLIYVSTKEPANDRRQPWTAIYKTNLTTGKTDRLTPPEHADLNPSVSPSGKAIAVASFEGKGGWAGEIEDLMTDIYVMNIEPPHNRRLVVKNGGWPTWGSDSVIFFHRKDEPQVRTTSTDANKEFWGVYRANISNGFTSVARRMTPTKIDGFTPAAIDANRVVVVTVREESPLGGARNVDHFRQIEVFGLDYRSLQITQRTTSSKADHLNPFLIDGGKRIGYHRCTNDKLAFYHSVERPFQTPHSPLDDVGLLRVPGLFPTVSKDGSKLAFVDSEYHAVWVADKDGQIHNVYEDDGSHRVWSPVWNQFEDTLYVCVGPIFSRAQQVNIYAIPKVGNYSRQCYPLTDLHNNAFPSSSPDGKRLVYRSTGEDGFKNLYIMENAKEGVVDGVKPRRLTNGDWTDTQCQWSPRGNWIVFSSTRDKPEGAPPSDNGLDPGYYAVYLVNPDDAAVCVRVIKSGSDISGHVNHPCFSPDGRSIAVTADLAAVSVDPVSITQLYRLTRSYGDIFMVDIDPIDIGKNKDVEKFKRITHSRHECTPANWSTFTVRDSNVPWHLFLRDELDIIQECPFGGDSSQTQLILPKRFCG